MAKVYRAPIDPPDFDYSKFDRDEYDAKNEQYLDENRRRAKENSDTPLTGEIIRFQRGDGYAEYMVWNESPLELIWLELGDAWSVEDALIRGLRISDVKQMVAREQAISEIFGRS